MAEFGKLREEANGYWGAFGVALEEEKGSFFWTASENWGEEVESEVGGMDRQFLLEEKNQEVGFRVGG